MIAEIGDLAVRKRDAMRAKATQAVCEAESAVDTMESWHADEYAAENSVAARNSLNRARELLTRGGFLDNVAALAAAGSASASASNAIAAQISSMRLYVDKVVNSASAAASSTEVAEHAPRSVLEIQSILDNLKQDVPVSSFASLSTRIATADALSPRVRSAIEFAECRSKNLRAILAHNSQEVKWPIVVGVVCAFPAGYLITLILALICSAAYGTYSQVTQMVAACSLFTIGPLAGGTIVTFICRRLRRKPIPPKG